MPIPVPSLLLLSPLAGQIGIVYIMLRLFWLVVAFNIMWGVFLWFLNAYMFNSFAEVGSFWATNMGQLVANLFAYLKVYRCLALILTTIGVKIARKYVVDKAYDAIFS